MLNRLLTVLVDSVLVLSLSTLVLGVIFLVFQTFKKRGAGAIKTITVITGILTAASALWIKATGAQIKPPDEVRDAIASFYRYVENKNFDQAFDLIHSARKEEMKQNNRGYEDFKNASASMRDIRNLQILPDKAEAGAYRMYLVSYDVKDTFPANTLREESWLASSVLMDVGLINQEKIMSMVLADLRRDYDFREELRPRVREYVRRTPVHYLFEPSFIEDVANWLHLTFRQTRGKDSWSHHIEYLKMQEENGWKIRSGLFPPKFSEQYPPYMEPVVLH